MEKQISIIIPTYNMEAYIGKCLDSLLIPEFDQVEVLVVNDGSKDRSSEIAHSYADRYPDSIRVIDKPNGNYGSCINAALPQCTGRYVKILDADDTFDTAEFSKLVNALKLIDDDVVITRHIIVTTDGSVLNNDNFPVGTKLDVSLSLEEAVKTIASHYIQMHRLAYNRRVFGRIKYHQTEGVSYTDSQWAIVPLVVCESFRCFDLIVYRYAMGREGQTMSVEQIAKHIGNFFTVLGDTLNYYINFRGNQVAKSLFSLLISEQHEYIYFNALRCLNDHTMQLLEEHDKKVKAKAPAIYYYISGINYQDGVSYKVFQNIRDKNYPSDFHIPFGVRLKLSTKVRLMRLLGKLKK